jgi:hypothetical protein|tara:strand:- start:5913 stop:6473 length:561 start_codon:yes stop_codon:yes gene_type:complete
MSHNPIVLDLADCVKRWQSKGYEPYISGRGSHPRYRNEVQATLEHMAKDVIGSWCDTETECHAWHESVESSHVRGADLVTEWRTGTSPYSFSISVPGLEVDDLWYLVNEGVVYRHTEHLEVDVGPGSLHELTGELEVEAQVIGATKINGGLQVHMAIYQFRDNVSGDSWGDVVSGGFAHWKQKGKS